jgi:hypothetical protein
MTFDIVSNKQTIAIMQKDSLIEVVSQAQTHYIASFGG